MRQTCREALFQYKFNDLAWRVRDEKSRREGGRGRKWTIESRSIAYRTVSRTSRRTWLANESLSGRVPRQVHACKIGAVQLYIQSGDIRSKAGNAPRLLTHPVDKIDEFSRDRRKRSKFRWISGIRRYIIFSSVYRKECVSCEEKVEGNLMLEIYT